ncbi:hypothetical protein FRC09_007655 [Ceratobasidium sp. 395]|nr:hypothetical protein FRC09_007655 [Ceratobasidium sp. 395]
MPANDPADQQAARSLELTLREAVTRLDRPAIELEWFMALPKRVRRSAQLIEAAQTESRVLLEYIRSEWTRTRRIEQEREERLEQARAQPRDLSCLRAPDPAAWNGLGRRKKRCRAFEAIGRAYQTRQHPHKPVHIIPAPVSDLATPDMARPTPSAPDSVDIQYLDPYVHTPRSLRDAVAELVYQVRGRDPYSSPTLSELHSLNPDYVSPPATPPECAIETYIPQNPFFESRPRWFAALGCAINGPLLTALSYGRVSSRPWAPVHTLNDLALSVAKAEQQDPGGLDQLCGVLFPDGVFEFASARVPTRAALDLVEGWLWMMEEHLTGQVPQLRSRCHCGGVIRTDFL